MKIRVNTYSVKPYNKKDIRLNIGLEFDTSQMGKMRTSAIVQLYPIAYFHGKVAEEAFGLLFLSAIIYATDRSVDRHIHSINGWSREFEVEDFVPAYDRFQMIQPKINAMLSFLTGDYWKISFVGNVNVNYPKFKDSSYYDDISQVSLFSGGLDSLVGAIDFLGRTPNKKLFLSSHYDIIWEIPRLTRKK